jgi:hypothetical protein
MGSEGVSKKVKKEIDKGLFATYPSLIKHRKILDM